MSKLFFKLLSKEHLYLTFIWGNDYDVRSNSFNNKLIIFDKHEKWFFNKLNNEKICYLIFFEIETEDPIGQVRIQKRGDENIIGILVDKKFRGKSYSVEMLNMACKYFFEKYQEDRILAYIKCSNVASINAFKQAKFKFIKNIKLIGIESQVYETIRDDWNY